MRVETYAIITAVRDEEKYIESTIQSVVAQTIRPKEWIIVNDGSRDRTGEIADQYASQHAWIRVVHRKDRGFRKPGGGVMEAFYDGYGKLEATDWSFLVKLDGDLSFEPTYFERCLERFERDPKLGIGGGEIHHDISGKMKVETNPRFHVRGATKIYRRACWEAIEGLWRAPGWDTIDEVKANMLGWSTYSFPELLLHHHRFTGAAQGLFRDRIKHGVACYTSGYHPLFLFVGCLKKALRRPYVWGSVGIIYGFLKSHIKRSPRPNDPRYLSYVQEQQIRRLLGKSTIWR